MIVDWIPVTRRLPVDYEILDKYGRLWISAKWIDEEGNTKCGVYVGRKIGKGFHMEGAPYSAKPTAWAQYCEPEPYVKRKRKVGFNRKERGENCD